MGPRQTPDVTPEMLDEEGRKRGKAQAWARAARAGAFVKDPFENFYIEGSLRYYSMFSFCFVALAFGRATPAFLQDFVHLDAPLQEILQLPALAIALASVGSSVYATLQAPEKNRDQFVWFVKGLFGGPLAVTQLRGLESLITEGEKEANRKTTRT